MLSTILKVAAKFESTIGDCIRSLQIMLSGFELRIEMKFLQDIGRRQSGAHWTWPVG